MDKYTKFILTIIAVGIIGLNYNLVLKGNIISKVEAANPDLEITNRHLMNISNELSNLVAETRQIWRQCD
jgi:hypothetical protein